MDTFDLPATGHEYRPNLAYLRKAIVLDRSARISIVRVSNSSGRSVSLFLRHADLYVVGFDLGHGPYHFSDMPAVGSSRRLEFRSDYGMLGLRDRTITLSASSIDASIHELSYHRPGAKGSQLFASEKDALVRLIFIGPEALRNWKMEMEVVHVLQTPGSQIKVNQHWGNGKPLSSWKEWSAQQNWPTTGIFVPHKG